MIIGFDFDKVFVDYPPLIPNPLIDLLYKGSTFFKRNTNNKNMHYRFPGLIEQKIRIATHYSIFRPLINENFEVLKEISTNKKNKTFLVSSRFGFLERRTKSLLKKYDLEKKFSGVFFNFKNNQPHIFKEKTILKLNIDTYIDDDIHLALYLANRIPRLKIFWITSSKPSKNLPKNIIPIKTLNDLKKHIKIK